MKLPLLLIITPPVEDILELIGHHVVAYLLLELPKLIDNLQECDHPLVWQEVDPRFGQQCPIPILRNLLLISFQRKNRVHVLVDLGQPPRLILFAHQLLLGIWRFVGVPKVCELATPVIEGN